MLLDKMEKSEGAIALDVEHFSKQGTEHLHQGQMRQALEAFTNAHKRSLTLGVDGYMQRACAFNLGALFITLGRYTDGLHYLQLAKPDDGRRDGRSNGDLYFNFGLAYEGLKNYAESRSYFEKALTDYRSERSNMKMEADTAKRLGQLCVKSGLYDEAEKWMKQLIQAYDSLGDKENRLQAEAERANLLLKMDRAEEAEEMADDCLKGAKSLMSPRIGNVFNELGLVYTQLTCYDKALDASESALALLRGPEGDPKLVAVLYQNIGALYNYSGKFEQALEYHKLSIEKHADLKNRKSQGHCFINQGYAYSQLNELDKAGECFLHALQAAKDCGDKKSEWQSFEALGTVAFNQGDMKRAQEYYKQSLSALGQSTEVTDHKVQERVLAKLTHIIQAQTKKSVTAGVYESMIKKGVQLKKPPQAPSQVQEDMISETKNLTHSTEDGSQVIAVRRGSKIKHLRVRRSGTLRKFKKFALGLDISRPGTAELKPWSQTDNASVLSAETIGEEEMDGMDEVEGEEEDGSSDEEEYVIEKEVPSGRSASKARVHSAIEEATDSAESGDELRKVQAEMQKVAHYQDIDPQESSGFESKKVKADVHAQQDESDTESDDESSDEDSSEESEGSEGEVPSHHKQRNIRPPPVPSLSPSNSQQASAIRTYETPIKNGTYESIEPGASMPRLTKTPPGETSLHAHRFSLAPSEGDGLNYFHEAESSQGGGGARPSSMDMSGTIYDTVKSLSGNDATPEVNVEPPSARDEEDDGDEEGLQALSRAQRDVFMYSEFKKDSTNSRDSAEVPDKTDKEEASQKNSKHCIVM